jgi:transcriptional regulator with XRE-family HTH domain
MPGDIEAATPALCRLYLGMELRKLRQAAGLTGKQVAESTAWSVPKITRMETGSGLVEPMDVRVLCQLYQANAELTLVLEGYAYVTKTKKDWWQSPEYRPAIPPGFKAYLGLEATASQMHEYESEFVPGLLQTEEYVRAIHRRAHQGLPPQEIDRLVAVRMTRQEILTRSEHPLKLSVIVNEAVLRRAVGSPAIMRDQLAHLVKITELPTVRLRVVPFTAGAHPGMNGPFIVLRFPDAAIQPIVYLENLASAGVTSRADDVDKYEDAFNDLTATALGHDKSRNMIEQARKEF